MIIDGPIKEDEQDPRFGYRITDVPNEDAEHLPNGDILGEWVRVGSSITPKGPDKCQLHEKFIRTDQAPAQIAYENGYRDGYEESMKDMAKRQLAKVEDELESLRDAVIHAARAGSPEAIKAAIAAMDAKTGYKPSGD